MLQNTEGKKNRAVLNGIVVFLRKKYGRMCKAETFCHQIYSQ